MDWVALWTAIAAFAAIIAAAGTVGTLLAVTLQLQAARVDREDDYYRKLTPFLSFETRDVWFSTATPGVARGDPAINVYADGGGYAFNVLANIVQTNATSGGGTLVGQRVLRYMREDRGDDPPLHVIPLSPRAAEGFQGTLKVTFVDMFGIPHEAQQAVRFDAADTLETTDALKWTCDAACRVHLVRPAPPPGRLSKFAQVLRLY
jgi:hypothetical protein